MPLVEFINRSTTVKAAARQNAGLLKLKKHAVNGRQSNVGAVLQKDAEYIFCRHVAGFTLLENFQNLQSRQSSF